MYLQYFHLYVLSKLLLKALFHFEIFVGTHKVTLHCVLTSILCLLRGFFVYAKPSVKSGDIEMNMTQALHSGMDASNLLSGRS